MYNKYIVFKQTDKTIAKLLKNSDAKPKGLKPKGMTAGCRELRLMIYW